MVDSEVPCVVELTYNHDNSTRAAQWCIDNISARGYDWFVCSDSTTPQIDYFYFKSRDAAVLFELIHV